jgi:hypothetical protein
MSGRGGVRGRRAIATETERPLVRARRISSAVGLAEAGLADATSARDRWRDDVFASEAAVERVGVSSWRPARAGGFRVAWSDFRS